jgi:type I restriction enzyme S subunit
LTKDGEISGSELPQGWTWARVDQVGEVQLGRQRTPDNRSDQYPTPYVRAANITERGLDLSDVLEMEFKPHELERFRLQYGDIILSEASGSPDQVGKPAMWRGEIDGCAFQNTVVRLRPPTELSPYLLHLFRYYYLSGAFAKVSSGVGINHLSASKFAAMIVPVAPLAEQPRIIAEIEQRFSLIDAGIASLKRAQANLKRYRASVLQAACTGHLVPTEAELARAEGCDYESADVLLQRILTERRARWEAEQLAKMRAQGKESKDDRWKAKYEQPATPDTRGLPNLPKGWFWVSLPALGELNRGKSKHRPRNDERLFGGPYPFIQTGDVKHSGGLIRRHSQTYSEFGLKQSRLWPAGTLCITIAANIAETGFLTYPACFPDSVVGFIGLGDRLIARWCELFLRVAKADLERFAPATAQKNINLETLYDVAVPLPPLAEQERIVAEVERRLSVADHMETVLAANLKRAERLKQSILRDAFAGRLVPQDPNDEPASVLLERIRSEREASASRANARGRADGNSRRKVTRNAGRPAEDGQTALPFTDR